MKPDVQQSTRERIIGTALGLFSAKGYLGTPTREIAAGAGIAEVTLFRHFPTKEAILEAVLAGHSFLPTLKELLPDAHALPYEKALRRIAAAYLETLDRRRDLVRIMHSECHLYPLKIQGILHAFLAEILATLAAFFEERRKKGELRSLDAELTARSFLGMFHAYFVSREVVGIGVDTYPIGQTIDGYVKIFSRGTRK